MQPVRPAPARPALPFRTSERLVYEAEFSRSLLRGIDVAEFRFEAQRRPAPQTARTSFSPEPAPRAAPAPGELVIRGEAVSKGFFSKLFGLDFRFEIESTVLPDGFALLRTTKRDEQGERVRTSEAVFDHASRRVTWTERDPKTPDRPPRVVTTDFGANVTSPQDVATVFYFLRTQPLEPGSTFDLHLSDSGQLYRVPVRVVRREQVDTALGKLPAAELAVDLFGPDRPAAGKGQMSVWITDDKRRLPVRARIRHDFGTLTIKLKRYSAG